MRVIADRADEVHIVFADGGEATATILKIGNSSLKGPDLSLLAVPTGDRPAVPVAKPGEAPARGLCQFIGLLSPADFSIGTMPCGYKSEKVDHHGQPLSVFIGDALPGDSGGPVLSLDGKLLGITVRTAFFSGVSLFFATPLTEIIGFLK